MLRDLERSQTVLAGVAGHRIFGASIALGDEPTVGDGIWVTGAYFTRSGCTPHSDACSSRETTSPARTTWSR